VADAAYPKMVGGVFVLDIDIYRTTPSRALLPLTVQEKAANQSFRAFQTDKHLDRILTQPGSWDRAKDGNGYRTFVSEHVFSAWNMFEMRRFREKDF
jgi:hypothetical protein